MNMLTLLLEVKKVKNQSSEKRLLLTNVAMTIVLSTYTIKVQFTCTPKQFVDNTKEAAPLLKINMAAEARCHELYSC